MPELRCITCNARIDLVPGSTYFKCPNCGQEIIARCGACRKSMRTYKCPNCGFEGP